MKKIKLFLKQVKNNTKLIFKALRKYLKDFSIQEENERLKKENDKLNKELACTKIDKKKLQDKVIRLERKGDINE